MLDINEIEKRLILHEGLVLEPYKCPRGFETIGVGHNIESRPFTEEEKRALGDYKHGITKNGALMLLRNDVAICVKSLKQFPFWKELDDERKYALLDMCFQLGINGLKKFKKMLSAIEVKDYIQASKECLNSEYAKQTPKRAGRIAILLKVGQWNV